MKPVLRALYALCATVCAIAQDQTPLPLIHAHAHNDYEHGRPLHDALANGYCSVEADIHLVNGELLVAHDRKDCQPTRTLRVLYLDPLRERIRRHGSVHANDAPFLLLIDVKSDAVPTYAVLQEILADYGEMLTSFRDNRIDRKAVTVILSGNRSYETVAAEPVRLVGVDGRLTDLGQGLPRTLVPLISDNWRTHFAGRTSLSDDDRRRLRELVKAVHSEGKQLRFWATPHDESLWQTLREAGVDWIGSDDLGRLACFFNQPPACSNEGEPEG